MNAEERRIIEALFQKLEEVDRRGGLREPEADALISQLAARQPGVTYYMAQAIVAQERALEAAQARMTELEERARAPQSSGSFLSGLFGLPAGGASSQEMSRRGSRPSQAAPGPWGSPGGQAQPFGRGGSGFLAGAAQTAVGVAGGVMLGSFLADMLTPDAAMAAEGEGDTFGGEEDPEYGAAEETEAAPDMGDAGDTGDDFGSDF